MRVIIIFWFVIFSTLCIADNEEFEPYFFRNNFNDDINNGYLSYFSVFRINYNNNNVYKFLDTMLYKNMTIGFIVDDLSKKYIILERMTFNGVLGPDYNDFNHRTHFVYTFKFNDTLSLNIVGMFAKSEWFFEASDSIASNRVLIIDKYILLPLLYNKKEQYREIIELIKDNNDPRLKNILDEILRDFPDVAK